jgi:hypothetical protein
LGGLVAAAASSVWIRLSFPGCVRGADVRIHLGHAPGQPLGKFGVQQEVKFHVVADENAPPSLVAVIPTV